MGSLTALDIIVLLLVGGGLVLGFMKGFVGEVLSLMAWVAGVVALKVLHEPVSAELLQPVGTPAGAAVLAFILIFGITFLVVKLIARRIGNATKKSAIGPVDRVLGGGFGALKGLIAATLLYLGANLFYDTVHGRFAERPDWMRNSRTFPLLYASGDAVVDFVERRRGPQPRQEPARR
jgi:membrane protein required for colicin V production